MPGGQFQLRGTSDREELSEDGTFVLRPRGREVGRGKAEAVGGEGGLGVKAPR